MKKHENQASIERLSAVRHQFDRPLVPGKLIRRYKRFLADVLLEDGSQVTAHCPNSGSMLTCLEEGAPVYLSPSDNPKRRTAFTWEMIFINEGWIGVNTAVPNLLAAQAARQRALPLFANAQEVRPEFKTSAHTRLDLLVTRPQGPLYVEVKNVTMVEGSRALFPDARTTRGAKHLQELMDLHQNGAEAAMLYIIQRQDATSFAPAYNIDSDYAELYYKARSHGVQIVAIEARVSPQGIHLHQPIPLAD